LSKVHKKIILIKEIVPLLKPALFSYTYINWRLYN